MLEHQLEHVYIRSSFTPLCLRTHFQSVTVCVSE